MTRSLHQLEATVDGHERQLESLRLEQHGIGDKLDELARAVWAVKAKAGLWAAGGAAAGSLGIRIPGWLEEIARAAGIF